MLSRLVILGSGGWFPAHGRQTACALLVDGERAVMIDAGSGVGRLVEQPELLDGVEELDIVLTHFHLDHVIGLAYLPALGPRGQTRVWGPGAALYGSATRDLLAPLLHEPLHPVGLQDQAIEVRDLPLGDFELAGTPIATRRQDRHSAPTYGLRFGDMLAWITDTAFDPDSGRFAEGCQAVAHECWYTSENPRSPEIHSSAAQAAAVAAEAGAERLMLIHLPPFAASVASLLGEASATFPASIAAQDGLDVSAMLVAA